VEVVRQFLRRAVLAIVGVPLLVLTAKLGGWWLAVALMLLTIPALREYYSGVQRHGARPASALGYLCATAMLLTTIFAADLYRDRLLLLILFASIVLVFLSCFDRRNSRGTLYDTATTIFGLVYIPLMMTFYVRLRDLDLPTLMGAGPVFLGGNVSTILLVLVPAWAMDAAAFSVGKAWGHRRLAPNLSPNKTVEGAIAGFLAAVAATLLMGVLWNHLPLFHAMVLGVLIGIFGQVGDLAESVLKRDIGLKDFGSVFGPHGGVLDRFDDILFVMPLAYFYLWLVFVVK